MPAVIATRFNAPLQQVHRTLLVAGKPWKVAITAVMRKLIVLVNALIRDDRKWAEINPRSKRILLMLSLDLTNAPRWHHLAPGVRVQLRPLTTALMVATRSDPVVETLPEDANDEECALAFAKALARRAVLAWEGVGGADGNAIEPSPEAIDALLDLWPIFEAFQLAYVSKGLLLSQEKNASAPLPSGPSAGASATARPARGRAPTARRG